MHERPLKAGSISVVKSVWLRSMSIPSDDMIEMKYPFRRNDEWIARNADN
jgi:hypothetical protein